MRLINATTLKLHSFIDDSLLPNYTILSHTWGADEVTFEDLRDARPSKLKHMAGYQKIRLAASQTLRDGFEYVWVDTCCIDKTSSAELSESINSMFRWYKQAQRCYAYLDDISIPEASPELWIAGLRVHGQADIEEEELAKARWFTRGWTLQELLAPRRIDFFIQGWLYIGDLLYLEPKIARITGIINALDSAIEFESFSVATRMSWAASRTTTRAEDMAYCLMGLFDANMPLLYGEGGPKAFSRLQQEVLANSSDCSIFAWTNPGDASVNWDIERPRLTPVMMLEDLSIFARTPAAFHDCDDLEWSPTGEIAVTSMGVKVELPIFSWPKKGFMGDLFIVMINWMDDSPIYSTTQSVGIVVRRCHKGRRGSPDLFIRQGGFDLVRNMGFQSYVQASDFRQMYLCKKLPDRNTRRNQDFLGTYPLPGSDVPVEKMRKYSDFVAGLPDQE